MSTGDDITHTHNLTHKHTHKYIWKTKIRQLVIAWLLNWFQCWFVAKSQLNSEEPPKNDDIIRADMTLNHPIRSWTIILSLCRPSNYTSESLPSCIVTVYKVSHNMLVVAKQQLPCGNAGGGSDAGRERVWIVPLSIHGGRVWLI